MQIARRIFRSVDPTDNQTYKDIVFYLETYQKAGENRNWDIYGKNLDHALRGKMREFFFECRRNGYINPVVRNGKLTFRQATAHIGQGCYDLCTLCERECEARTEIDTGELKRLWAQTKGLYDEKPKCWA